MTDQIKTKKPRTPRNYQSILSGALSLPLNERVALAKAVKESILKEVEESKAAAAKAESIMNGL